MMTKTEKKRRFRPARFVLIAAASLVLVAAAVLSLVRLGTFDRLLLAEVSRRLEAAAGLRLEAEKIEVDPFNLSLSLKRPTLRAVAGRAPVLREFSADAVFLDIPRSVIFGGRLRFQRVRVVHPVAVLVPFHDQHEEPDTPAPPGPHPAPADTSTAPAGFDLRIDDFELEDGFVSWGGRAGSFGISLEDIDVRVRYDTLQQNHLATLTAAGGHLEYSNRDLGLGRLALRGRFGAEEIVVERLEIATGASSISLTGSVKDYAAAPEFSGKARLSLALPEIPFPARFAAGAEGTLTAEVSISGKTGVFTYDADVSTTGLRTRELGSGSLAGRVHGDLTSLVVSGLDLRTEAGLVRGRFTADMDSKHVSGVELEWKDLDPDRIIPLLPFSGDLPVSLGSLVSGRLEGKAEPLSLEGFEGSAFLALVPKLTPETAPSEKASGPPAETSPGLGKPPLRPAGEIALRASGGEFRLDTVRLTAAGVSLEASGSFGPDDRLEGRYSIRVESIPETVEALRSFGDLVRLPFDLFSHPEKTTGSVFVAGAIRGRITAPAFTAGIAVPKLEYQGVRASSLKADLEGDLEKVTLRDLSAMLAGGAIRASGTIVLGPHRRAGAPAPRSSARQISPSGRFTLQADKVQLGEVAALLPESWGKDVEGSFTGRADVTTGPGGFAAAFSVEGTSLASSGRRFPLLKFRGTYDPSRLDLNDILIETEQGALSGRGGFDLENRTISANLHSEGFGLEVLRPLLPAGFDLGGRATLTLDAEGELSAPRGRLTLSIADLRAGPFAVPSLQLEAKSDGRGLALTFSGREIRLGPSETPSGPEPPSSPVASIEGRILAAGSPFAPATFKVDGEISRLIVAFGGVALSNPEAIRFHLGQGILHIDSFDLTGTAGSFSVSGTAGPLPGIPSINGRIHSDIDITALSPFVSGMLVGGRLKADVDIRGGNGGPAFSGRAVLENAFVRVNDFPLILSGVSADLSFEDSHLTLGRLEGTANGGPLRIQGGLDGLLSPVSPSGRFSVEARNFQLNYPPGLRTTSDIALTLTGDGGSWTLAGDMKILRGLFREDISPGGQILGFGSYRWARSESELPAFIRGIRLDIAVDTVEPIVFKNNLANVEVQAELRVSGNPGLPLFSGRMQNAAVGEIVFGERRFVLETARIDLLGQRIPDPNLEIVAHTSISHNLETLDVRLQLSGPSSDLRYSLTSTPPRSKEDLSLILLTGRSLEEVRGNAVDTLTTQAIQFFSSPIASPVTRTLERVLKIEDVSVEPLIISAEADPGARLTLRKRISEQVAVTYSVDITSTQNQTWILDYRLKRNFSLQAFRKDNGSYGGSLRHSIPIGPKALPAPGAGPGNSGGRPILSGITFAGEPKLPPGEVDSALRRLRQGKPFSYSLLSDALDKLLKTYKKRGFANADTRPTVTTSDDGTKAAILLAFSPGNPVRVIYNGDKVASRVRRSVRRGWTGLLPEDVNLDEARGLILEKLHRKGHYEARVEAEKREATDESLYRITVEKGPRYGIRNFSVEGNAALPTEAIRKAAAGFPQAKYKGLWNLVYNPGPALDSILNIYRELGYADARVRRPRVTSDATARIVDIRLAVEEGPRRMVHKISFEGNAALVEADLRSVVRTVEGKPYNPALLLGDEDSLLAYCRSHGYRQAAIESEAVPRTGDPDVDILFKIREGPVHTVSSLEVVGARHSREGLVLKTAGIKRGDVFSFESLAVGQKRLYDLGVFRAVNISTPESEKESTDVPVVVDVRELPPFTLTYGVRYNNEDKLEGQVELTLLNLLGGGRTGYASYRRGSRLWDARLSVKVPYVFGLRADTRFSFSNTREWREAYISDEIAATLGQDTRLLKKFNLSIFYRLSRVREKEPDALAFGPPVVLSEFSLSLIRDTRDDRFDPRSGSFLSLSLTGASKVLGSELSYVRVFSQYSFYRNIGRKLTWASNARLGLTTAFRQELLASQLFYAGGGTSIRGFDQDRVGPIDPMSGLPMGGKIVLLVNQEIRVPLFFWFSGVVFYDVGNVYASFRNMTRFALRQGLGAGLRVESPIGLIRFDCGFNLFRRPREPSTVLFLSIGQAF
jgi:outer membrane protein assembly complex protein YaeT